MKYVFRYCLSLLAVALLLGAASYASYQNTEPRIYIIPELTIMGEKATILQETWKYDTCFGLLHRERVDTIEATPLSSVYSAVPSFEDLPEQGFVLSTLSLDGTRIFSGDLNALQNFVFLNNGSYELTLYYDYDALSDGSGDAVTVKYIFPFTLKVTPIIQFSSFQAKQADILTIFVDMKLGNHPYPEVSIDWGTAVFAPLGNNQYLAYVPTALDQKGGTYTISVFAGGNTYQQEIVVEERQYATQFLTMPEETVQATTGKATNADFTSKVTPTMDMFDKEKYWAETFLLPIDAPITTPFGAYRFTNGKAAVRHNGIDLAMWGGYPVPASNRGKVVFAGNVISTGNTVVLEHGCGLKTYYYHLMSIEGIQTGDIVERGQIIGTVGNTGYSTGAHLHFEVRLGKIPISPWELFDGTSQIYFIGE